MTKAVQEIVQLQAQVADLQSQLADVPALVAEVVRLRESLDPGKSAAIIDAMFSEANRLGRQQYSSSHALTYLVAEVERLRETEDATRLLGVARMALGRAAVYPTPTHSADAIRKECADVAQRIVDLIGHPVTDEPPHVLVERDELRAEVEQLRAEVEQLREGDGRAKAAQALAAARASESYRVDL